MLGHYLCEQFADCELTTLGRSETNSLHCDLVSYIPQLGDNSFTGVVHAAGSEEESDAMELNLTATQNLIKALEKNPPEWIVYISSHQVYNRNSGENISEDHPLNPDTVCGKSKAQAENILRQWCEDNHVSLTILRPAYMFGSNVHGEMARLFNYVINGEYVNIRGNEARLSIVTAHDVARTAKILRRNGGVFNVATPEAPTLRQLTEAMSLNTGSQKRMTTLPRKWADWIWRMFRFVPAVDRQLNPDVIERRATTFTLDSSRLNTFVPDLYDTLAVISRTDARYPYEEN